MAISKITLNGVTQMDVTQDTVDEDNLLYGETATKSNGVRTTGAVVTAAIDDTLSNEGEAADAKATGDAITAVLNVSSATGSPHQNYWTAADVRFNCKKMGSLVSIDFEGVPTTSFGAWYTFGTVPEGYRPPDNLPTFAIHNRSTVLPMQITTNGSMQLFVALPSLARLTVNVTYFV